MIITKHSFSIYDNLALFLYSHLHHIWQHFYRDISVFLIVVSCAFTALACVLTYYTRRLGDLAGYYRSFSAFP